MNDISTFIIATAAVIGALFSATLGWLDSAEPFEPRKFTSSILRAIVAGIVLAVGYVVGSPAQTVTLLDALLAFLSGMGIDAGGNRLAGAIGARNQSTTPS